MSATYDEESGADLDWIRSQLGDTEVDPEENALLTDERIAFVLAQHPDNRALTLSQLAHELVAQFGQQPDSVRLPSGLNVSFKTLLDRWKALSQPYVDWLAAQAKKPASTTTSTVPLRAMFGVARGRRG
jgi:hypothetical protein